MREREHIVVLSGAAFRRGAFRPEATGRFLRALPDALLNAVRMRFFASSRRIGRPGVGIERATEVWATELAPHGPTGGVRLTLRLPLLGEAAPEFFQQPTLFNPRPRFGSEPKASATAFDLLTEALRAVSRGETSSDLFDRAMLGRLALLNPEGIERAAFARGAAVDGELLRAAGEIDAATPAPYRTRVLGMPEAHAADARVFALRLRDGTLLRALWTGEEAEALRRGFGVSSLMEGMATFRASGGPLVFEADTIRPAVEEDRYWERAPRGVAPALRAETPLLPGVRGR